MTWKDWPSDDAPNEFKNWTNYVPAMTLLVALIAWIIYKVVI